MSTLSPRRPSSQAAALLVCVALAGGTGCDSLLGESGLAGTFGTSIPEPANVSWELRWFQGAGAGMVSPCELLQPVDGSYWFDYDFGTLEAAPPTPGPPPVAIDGETFSWSLALLGVVDAAADEPRPSSDLDPFGGVWGLAPIQAVLHIVGDVEALSEALEVDGTPDAVALVEGYQTVEIFPDVVLATGDVVGALQPVDPTLFFTEQENSIVVDSLDIVADAPRALFSGEGLGGVTFEECP